MGDGGGQEEGEEVGADVWVEAIDTGVKSTAASFPARQPGGLASEDLREEEERRYGGRDGGKLRTGVGGVMSSSPSRREAGEDGDGGCTEAVVLHVAGVGPDASVGETREGRAGRRAAEAEEEKYSRGLHGAAALNTEGEEEGGLQCGSGGGGGGAGYSAKRRGPTWVHQDELVVHTGEDVINVTIIDSYTNLPRKQAFSSSSSSLAYSTTSGRRGGGRAPHAAPLGTAMTQGGLLVLPVALSQPHKDLSKRTADTATATAQNGGDFGLDAPSLLVYVQYHQLEPEEEGKPCQRADRSGRRRKQGGKAGEAGVPRGLREKAFGQELEALKELYSTLFTARLYIYKGLNLISLHKKGTINPYLVVHNGTFERSDRSLAVTNQYNPDFYRSVVVPTRLPQNSVLSIEVWSRQNSLMSEISKSDRRKVDELIGVCRINLEHLLLRGLKQGPVTSSLTVSTPLSFMPLVHLGSSSTKGSLQVQLDLLPEHMATRSRVKAVSPPKAEKYELRMVLWSTKHVRHKELHQLGLDVDQKIGVTFNFSGQAAQDEAFFTDTAWFCSGGNAPWNYRMVFPIMVPAKVPRLTITMWDAKVVTSDIAIGSVMLNLGPLIQRALRDKAPEVHEGQRWCKLTHPNAPGVNLGEVLVELWLLKEAKAQERPVGWAQSEPNQDPYLPSPHRNPPPWAVGTRSMDYIARQRRKIIIFILCLIFLPIAGISLFPVVQGFVFSS